MTNKKFSILKFLIFSNFKNSILQDFGIDPNYDFNLNSIYQQPLISDVCISMKLSQVFKIQIASCLLFLVKLAIDT